MYYNDEAREALDPVPWIENTVAPLQPQLPTWSEPNDDDEPKEINQALVDSAITEWRNTPKGYGHLSFFLLKRKLKNAGMDASEIATSLEVEATFARSPNDRKAQIPSIIESLQKRKLKT